MSGETPPNERQKAAYQAGRDAFTSGADVKTCPHPTAGPEGLQVLWVRGFVAARREAGAQPAPAPRQPFVLRKG